MTTRITDLINHCHGVAGGVGMDIKNVHTGIGKHLYISAWLHNHHVELGLKGRVATNRLHVTKSQREVGNILAVHDIEVQPAGAGSLQFSNLMLEVVTVGAH